MKKTLLVLAVLFIVNLGCKKTVDPGGGLCACSILVPTLSITIKNGNGLDLLNTENAGAFNQKDIQLYIKDANGNNKAIAFNIRPPFSYGTNQLNYFQLFSSEIISLIQKPDQSFFLKLGNNKEVELNITKGKDRTEKLFVNKVEAPLEIPAGNNIFAIVL